MSIIPIWTWSNTYNKTSGYGSVLNGPKYGHQNTNLVITNEHIIKGKPVQSDIGIMPTIKTSYSHDLSLLECSNDLPAFTFEPAINRMPKCIVALNNAELRPNDRVDHAVHPGHSGSPLFNTKGDMSGLIMGQNDDTYVIPSMSLIKFILNCNTNSNIDTSP